MTLAFPQKVEDWQLTGADYAMHIADPKVKKLNPVGKWNNTRIIFNNGHVEHWLNGAKIVEFEAWTPEWFKLKNSGKWNMAPEYGLSETGYIALQDHGSKIWFRNMKIKELPKKAKAAVALFNGVDLSNWVAYGTEKWFVQDSLLICESGPDKKITDIWGLNITIKISTSLSTLNRFRMVIVAFSFAQRSRERPFQDGNVKLLQKGTTREGFTNLTDVVGCTRSRRIKKTS